MNEIVIPGLYLAAGAYLYATFHQLSIGLGRHGNQTHLLFGGMCLLMALFSLGVLYGYRADTVDRLVPPLKWSLATAVLFFALFPWFTAEYTGVRPRWFLAGWSVLVLVLFVVNLIQPYGLQFREITAIELLPVPWGESLSHPEGPISPWFGVAIALVLTAFAFAFYALGRLYCRAPKRSVLVMILGVTLFLLTAMEGILARMSVIDFIVLGPFGYLGMVIAMGVTLAYESRERLRLSESRFRSFVEQSPFSIQILAPSGATTMVNRAWERMWGVEPEVLAENRLLPLVQRIFAEETTGFPAVLYHHPAGHGVLKGSRRERWIRTRGYPIKDSAGRVSEVVLIHEDVTDQKREEEAIHRIAAGVSAESGEEFFRRFVQHLAGLFGADYAFIAVLAGGNPGAVETLAVCTRGRITENFTYTLAGTPCADVVGGSTCAYSHEVQRRFPEDRLLADMRVEGYIGTPLFGSAGQPLGLIAVMDTRPLHRVEQVRDILEIFAARAASEIERMRAQESLRLTTEQLRATIEFTPNVGIQWYDDQKRILLWNGASERIFGWKKDEALGKTLDQLVYTPDQAAAFSALCAEVQRTGKPAEPKECPFRHRDGTLRTAISAVFPLPDGSGRARFVCTDVDVTDQKRAETQIHRMAYHDVLTDLPNRQALREHLEKAMRSGEQGAMLLVDLDHFKTINDALGHHIGDEVLCAVANRLVDTIGDAGFIARLGGDEFVAVLEGLPGSKGEATAAADALAREIAENLAVPIVLDDRVFNVGASIGATLFQEGRITVSDILRQADMALYLAKDRGRGNVQFFLPSLQEAADQRLKLERGLRSALAKNELEIYFQPQVTAAGQVFGAEALLRWRHPELGLVSPAVFIPIAEETGLIHAVGEWVLREACSRLGVWSRGKAGFTGHLSVNLSPWQFARTDFVQSFCGLLAEQGTEPGRLVLEVTESALLYDIQETIEKLTALKSAGFRVSLDDFGTGYSSLAYLKELPLDILKIDKAFVDELKKKAGGHPIVNTILALGHNMNLMVIAEGVETEAQRDQLLQSGCNGFQGYLFCRPLPADDFTDWLVSVAGPAAGTA